MLVSFGSYFIPFSWVIAGLLVIIILVAVLIILGRHAIMKVRPH